MAVKLADLSCFHPKLLSSTSLNFLAFMCILVSDGKVAIVFVIAVNLSGR